MYHLIVAIFRISLETAQAICRLYNERWIAPAWDPYRPAMRLQAVNIGKHRRANAG